MRALFCGSRDWDDIAIIKQFVISLRRDGDTVLIHGDCRGADKLAAQAGKEILGEDRVLAFPAKWDEFGNAAGPIRNQQMIDEGHPDIVFAFHNDLEKSRGTKDMVFRANKAGIRVYIFTNRRLF